MPLLLHNFHVIWGATTSQCSLLGKNRFDYLHYLGPFLKSSRPADKSILLLLNNNLICRVRPIAPAQLIETPDNEG